MLTASQVVAVSGVQCSPDNVAYGVPQGSVLGLLLFIIYVDDVVHQISLTSYMYISLYADDIDLYRCIRSPTDYVVLQSDIAAISTWIEEENYLKLHPDQCRLMFISRKRTHSITPPPLYINKGFQIQSTDSVKYLGILLTSDLT